MLLKLEDGEYPGLRKLIAAVAGLAVLGSAMSVAMGPGAGRRLGYQLMTAHSAGLSWLIIAILLAVTGVPLATFMLREELYMYNKWKMRFILLDRDERPVEWWLMLWVSLVLFVVILALLFMARVVR